MRKSPGEASHNYLYNRYRYSAKRNKRTFSLTKIEFQDLINQNCFYCGAPPKPFNYYTSRKVRVSPEGISRAWINANGIDRLDSLNGYQKENCVACCTTCNLMKLDHNLKDFLGHLQKILNFSKERGIL